VLTLDARFIYCMSTKSKSQTPVETSEPEFVLKHRIVGAAFLLFFGALFLPWLLGPPSAAVKLPASDNSLESDAMSVLDVEEDLQQAIDGEQISGEEQVYISKITPLDRDKASLQAKANQLQAQSETATETPIQQAAKKDVEAAAPTNTSNSNAANASTSSAPQNESNSSNGPAAEDDKQSSTTTAKTVQQTAPPKTNAQATNQPKPQPKVDVGWMVQVGVFTDKRGASRVVADLRAKGFSPSTSIVDTNRGKATGTRIWLGPYAQRVEAAKAKTQLTNKTGEAGFIRAYP